MDLDDELKRFKWMLASGLTFLLSGYFSYTDLKYMIWGKTAEAQVIDVRETVSGRRGKPMVSIRYSFTESDGTSRSEFDAVPASSPLAEAQTMTVQYLPGVEKASRFQERAEWTWIVVVSFFGSVVWLGSSIIQLAREANRPIARGSGRRSS